MLRAVGWIPHFCHAPNIKSSIRALYDTHKLGESVFRVQHLANNESKSKPLLKALVKHHCNNGTATILGSSSVGLKSTLLPHCRGMPHCSSMALRFFI